MESSDGHADMETQVYPAEDPIQSFQDTPMEDQIEDMPTPKPLKKIQKKAVVDVVDRGLECECDVTVGECVDSRPRFIHSSQDRRRELFLRGRLWTLVPFMVSHHFFD
jgi:hypothetical protein